MRITDKTIVFVKESGGKDHNPQTVFTVMLKDNSEHDLKHYSLYNLPKGIKKWLSGRDYEIWYEGTDLVTYVWKTIK